MIRPSRSPARARPRHALPYHVALLLALRAAPRGGLPLHDPPLPRRARHRAVRS